MNRDLTNELRTVLWAKAKTRYPQPGLGTMELRQSYVIGCLYAALDVTGDRDALAALIEEHRNNPETAEEVAA